MFSTDLLGILMGSALTIFGYQTYRVANRIIPYFTTKKKIVEQLAGNWVVVAGATDGIGSEFVKYLHQRKCKIVLLGRSHTKLQALMIQYPESVTAIVDFKEDQIERIQQIEGSILQKIQQFDGKSEGRIIGFVNSVGVAHFSRYNSLSYKQIKSIQNVNIGSLNFLLKLKQTISQKETNKNQSFFINISSTVAQNPHKYCSVYSATKAYLSNLVESVSLEKDNVVFLDVRPWYVKTKMVAYLNTWDSVQPRQVVEGSFRVLGKRRFCSGSVKHELIDEFSWFVRDSINRRIQDMMKRVESMQALRRRRK